MGLSRREHQRLQEVVGDSPFAKLSEAIGARVEARAGDLLMKRQVLADPIYLSSASRVVHFGIGQRATLPQVRIDWPSGVRQGLVDVPARFVPTQLNALAAAWVPPLASVLLALGLILNREDG